MLAVCHLACFTITFLNAHSDNANAAFIDVPSLLPNLQAADDRMKHGLRTPERIQPVLFKLWIWKLLSCVKRIVTFLHGLGRWDFFNPQGMDTYHITLRFLFMLMGISRDLLMGFSVTGLHYKCENVTWK